MTKVTSNGRELKLAGSGELPKVGETAPDFKLAGKGLVDMGLDDFRGKNKILNINLSLDTGICATSARRFNEAAAKLPNTVVLNISADLPFAAARFCESEGLDNVVALSTFRSQAFGRDYGVGIVEGPLAGLMTRAVVVLDTENKVIYNQMVPETGQEPDYDGALAAVDGS